MHFSLEVMQYFSVNTTTTIARVTAIFSSEEILASCIYRREGVLGSTSVYATSVRWHKRLLLNMNFFERVFWGKGFLR
jgi:hypothetical protein